MKLSMLKQAAAVAAFGLPLAIMPPAAADETVTIQLDALNGSGASGTAEVYFDDDANAITVNIDAMGLVPNLPHAQHIHIGGRNVCPDPSADTDGDGVVSTPEGKPAYGAIQVSLTTEGDFGPGSTLAIDRFPVASASGEVSYERTFDLTETMGDIELDDIVIVQHGIDTISPNGKYGPKPPASPLDKSLPLEATAPATCGPAITMPAGGVEAGGGGTAGVEHDGLLALGGLSIFAAAAVALRRRRTEGVA